MIKTPALSRGFFALDIQPTTLFTAMTSQRQWIVCGAFFAILGATFLVYSPGLWGPLVLDDLPNLKRLAHIGPIQGSSDFLQFVFSSSGAYPIRPLSFASFLINDTGWPLHTPSHKYTNVLIHLLNGALVFWLGLVLGRLTKLDERKASIVALSAAALWSLNPLQVSTVLYVIQRMTQLSTLFVLCGLITYCYGRLLLNERPVAGHIQMTTGVAIFGTLGFLCKENAVLLPLYVLAIERALAAPRTPIEDRKILARFRVWKWLFLVAPVVMALVVLVYTRGIFDSYDYRPFTAFERIASQPRILFDYLQNLLIPLRQGMGVAHDDYVLSTGLWSPPSTLPAMLALAGLAAAALYLSRHRFSPLAFAVLWFLAGHVLESSVLALEPYFEHRNYLPMFGPLFALSFYVWTARIRLHAYLKAGLVVYLTCFALITLQNVEVWSNKLLMADAWARDHPRSVRAQQMLADTLAGLGKEQETHEIIGEIADQRPGAMSPQIQHLLSACRADPANIGGYLRQTRKRISGAHFDHAVIPTLRDLTKHRGQCPNLSNDNLLALVDHLLNQDSVYLRSKAVADLLFLRATILAQMDEVEGAVAHLYAAFQRRPSHDLGFVSVELLYNLGEYREALKALEQTEAIELKPWSPDQFRSKELEAWRQRLREAIDKQSRE